MSSPADELAEASRTLLRKAHGDAQQAVEKWLKAVIAGRGERFEHTHDLRRLLVLATQGEVDFPVHADSVVALTQYSVPLRYEDLLDAEPLNREGTVELIDAVGQWAITTAPT